MALRITQLRLSFIWIETFGHLVPPSAPMAFLAQQDAYENEFEKAKAGTSTWNLPWPKPNSQHFWERYLEGINLRYVDAGKARKLLVPFWLPELASVKTSATAGRVKLEGFFYPHAVAVVTTVTLRGVWPLFDVVDQAVNIRNSALFDVTWPNGPTQSLRLNALASNALDLLRQTALGQIAPQGRRLEPFTVVTFIGGYGIDVDLDKPNLTNGDVHRGLEALCEWDANWRINTLRPIDAKTSLDYKGKGNRPPSHILYALRRGRVVWFPGYFETKQRPISPLGCYHRNLTLLTLQIESAWASVNMVAEMLETYQLVPIELDQRVRPVALLLGRLYGAASTTYRSWSARAQIDANNYAPTINKVRSYWGQPILS